MIGITRKEEQIIAGLKDFQRATVDRVFELFTGGHSRVLVADEVGLGKTLIAKGVIARTAMYHQQILKDELFKVVYVCSNQSIAGQNLAKLKIDETDSVESLSDTRLSMQHLRIFEDEHGARIRQNNIQLIPLTPTTSFNMIGGCGSVQERALIYAILRRHPGLKPYLREIEIMMIDYANTSWNAWARDNYEQRVLDCDRGGGNAGYINTMLGRVEDYLTAHDGLLDELKAFCERIRKSGDRTSGSYGVIHKLRRMMAEISVELLDADLVIMDEFQRFPELIKVDADDETSILARRFFNASKRDHEKVKILLLSATPYKLYSTLEEINENQADEHYREFMQVTDFLFESEPAQRAEFRRVWSGFSFLLNEIGTTGLTCLSARKKEAEDALYGGICRTERMAVKGADSFIDNEMAKNTLEIAEGDILSFVEANTLVSSIGLNYKVPVEYVKSAPYILSFMDHYKLKETITGYFKKNQDKIKLARKSKLWIDEESVARYEKLPETNARMKKIREVALPRGAERLMWIPPSRPYYQLSGPFANARDFSKVLVFSSWEMAPRAIASLISYDAERLTVGDLIRKSPNPEKENRSYFPYRNRARFPSPRLKFSMRDDAPASMALMCLLYPSLTLARLYNPIEALNARKNYKQLKAELGEKITELLEHIQYTPKKKEIGHDESWYYIAPLLFDLHADAIGHWLENPEPGWDLDSEDGIDADNDADEKGAFAKHLDELKAVRSEAGHLVMGRKPRDLVDILVNMALASPAVCAVRMFGIEGERTPERAARLAKTIMDRFNSQEATSIVELVYSSGKPHWQSVLKYCADGNMQTMLDEYAHMLTEANGLMFATPDIKSMRLCAEMVRALKTHTASYNVDTYPKFRDRIIKGEKRLAGREKGEPRYIKMRSSYAVGFYDTRGADKSKQRKDNLRLAFNSPFRPFVLATTSIGQEGLDFHYYCRKIVHWNLPANPIDLEQREGRINRYKCLAIRQNIARKHGDIHFLSDVWQEMFDRANAEEKKDGCPELVPFWCLPDNQNVKIERIVPMYPLSRDQAKYERLIKILSLYRLSLGQARQEELIEYVLQSELDDEQIKELFINLSPYYKREQTKNNIQVKKEKE